MMNANATAASPVEDSTLNSAIQLGAARLSRAGIDNARLDAEVLLRHILDLEQSELFLRLNERLSSPHRDRYRHLVARRARREPLAYIIGHKEFWSLDFLVSPAVLVPRPESELLVELALDYARKLPNSQNARILDIGTGSGAIAVSLAMHLPDAQICATDISAAALQIAAVNAYRHGLKERVRFIRADVFDGLGPPAELFDLVVSNPPYIRRAELAALAPEIYEWEPRGALDGGSDGLDYYRRIIAAAPVHLADGGRVLLEIGSDLSEAVSALIASAGCYSAVKLHRDYAGRERVVMAVKGGGCG